MAFFVKYHQGKGHPMLCFILALATIQKSTVIHNKFMFTNSSCNEVDTLSLYRYQ